MEIYVVHTAIVPRQFVDHLPRVLLVLTAGKDILSEVKTFGMTFEASFKRKQQAQELTETESLGQTKDMAATRDKLAAPQQL